MTQAEAIERVRELSKTQVTVSAELAAKALGTTGQTIREAARQGGSWTSRPSSSAVTEST